LILLTKSSVDRTLKKYKLNVHIKISATYCKSLRTTSPADPRRSRRTNKLKVSRRTNKLKVSRRTNKLKVSRRTNKLKVWPLSPKDASAVAIKSKSFSTIVTPPHTKQTLDISTEKPRAGLLPLSIR